MDLGTRKLLSDKIEWVKVSGIAWRGNGFYYSRYPAPAKGKELSSINEDHRSITTASARRSRPTSWCSATRRIRSASTR